MSGHGHGQVSRCLQAAVPHGIQLCPSKYQRYLLHHQDQGGLNCFNMECFRGSRTGEVQGDERPALHPKEQNR